MDLLSTINIEHISQHRWKSSSPGAWSDALAEKLDSSPSAPGWIAYLKDLPFRLFSTKSDSDNISETARLTRFSYSILASVTVKPVKTSNLVEVSFDRTGSQTGSRDAQNLPRCIPPTQFGKKTIREHGSQ